MTLQDCLESLVDPIQELYTYELISRLVLSRREVTSLTPTATHRPVSDKSETGSEKEKDTSLGDSAKRCRYVDNLFGRTMVLRLMSVLIDRLQNAIQHQKSASQCK